MLRVIELPRMPRQLVTSTYGWDMVRAAMLARRGVALGWVRPEQVLEPLHAGFVAAHSSLSSWAELGQSFYLGRSLWMVTEGVDVGAVAIALHEIQRDQEKLLYDPQSPWVRLPWPC